MLSRSEFSQISLGTALSLFGMITGCREPASRMAGEESARSASSEAGAATEPDRAALQAKAEDLFGIPEPDATTEDSGVEAARVALGRMLYYEHRISKNHDLSCNSCHDLENYGVDSRTKDGRRTQTSMGHKDVFGGRNSPTTYNAYLHVAQFWDGRAKDVEEQAKGPVLNPVEMAMPGAEHVVRVLRTIPGYRPMFQAAFPGDDAPISYDNFAAAIGAFERKLVTPAPIDDFMAGNLEALTNAQLRGFEVFNERCVACHVGPTFGGAIYQKLGLMKDYKTTDKGRYELTQNKADEYFFKVPSLRNITETGPYLHDGSVATLEEMVDIMAEYQTPQGKLGDSEKKDLIAFLKALTGKIPADFVAKPALPVSGPKTPRPDPS